jgi:hypothetical protein
MRPLGWSRDDCSVRADLLLKLSNRSGGRLDGLARESVPRSAWHQVGLLTVRTAAWGRERPRNRWREVFAEWYVSSADCLHTLVVV